MSKYLEWTPKKTKPAPAPVEGSPTGGFRPDLRRQQGVDNNGQYVVIRTDVSKVQSEK